MTDIFVTPVALAICAVLKARAEATGLDIFPVALAWGKHLFPFRTEQLSPTAPMVLGPQGPGRVGRRRFLLTSRPPGGSFSLTVPPATARGAPGTPGGARRGPHRNGARASAQQWTCDTWASSPSSSARGVWRSDVRCDVRSDSARAAWEAARVRWSPERRGWRHQPHRRARPPRPGAGGQGRSVPACRVMGDRRDADLGARAAHAGPARAHTTTEWPAVRVLGRGGGGPGLPRGRPGRCLAQRGELQRRVDGASHQLAKRALGRAAWCRRGWEHVFVRLGRGSDGTGWTGRPAAPSPPIPLWRADRGPRSCNGTCTPPRARAGPAGGEGASTLA